jgi:hypothetical protein
VVDVGAATAGAVVGGTGVGVAAGAEHAAVRTAIATIKIRCFMGYLQH